MAGFSKNIRHSAPRAPLLRHSNLERAQLYPIPRHSGWSIATLPESVLQVDRKQKTDYSKLFIRRKWRAQLFALLFVFMQTHALPHFSPPETPDSLAETSGVGYFFDEKWRRAIKTATDSGNCGIFQKIPPAGMTRGGAIRSAGMRRESGKWRRATVFCVLCTCNLHGAEPLCTVFCQLASPYLSRRKARASATLASSCTIRAAAATNRAGVGC